MYDYYVYIVQCNDASYYTGVTNNYERRLLEHNREKNPTSYTFIRRPVRLVYLSHFTDICEAIAWEKQLKGWSRRKKKALIQGDQKTLEMAAICINGSKYCFYGAIACHTERRRSVIRVLLRGVVSIPRLRSE